MQSNNPDLIARRSSTAAARTPTNYDLQLDPGPIGHRHSGHPHPGAGLNEGSMTIDSVVQSPRSRSAW